MGGELEEPQRVGAGGRLGSLVFVGDETAKCGARGGRRARAAAANTSYGRVRWGSLGLERGPGFTKAPPGEGRWAPGFFGLLREIPASAGETDFPSSRHQGAGAA